MKCTAILFIFFYINSNAQTIDTLHSARSYYNSLEYSTFNGVDLAGHVYGIEFSKDYQNGVWGNVKVLKIDFTTMHVTSLTLPNSATSTGIVWRSVMDSSGVVYCSQATGVRQLWRIDFRQEDTIIAKSFGNTSKTGVGLAYSISLSRTGGMLIGNSSSPTSCDGAYMLKNSDSIVLFNEFDANNGYVISEAGDTAWDYFMTGQNYYAIFGRNKSTGISHEIMRRNDGFPYNLGALQNGCYVSVGGGATWRLTDGDTARVPPATAGTTNIAFRQTKVFNDDPVNLPLVSTFLDPSTSKYYFSVNGVTNNVQLPSNAYPNSIFRVYPDLINNNKLNFIGALYGYYTDYFISQDSAVVRGFIGINTYLGMQLSAHKWLYVGYPSSTVAVYDDRLPWTAETFANGAYLPLGATTNPKNMGAGRSTSDVHEPNKLTMLANGLICFGGNEIRTGNTVGFNWFDTSTNILNGMNGDHFTPRQFQDLAAWGNKMILSTSSAVNHGKLFIFDGVSKTLVDSLDFGYKNMGYIFVQGDRLYFIAQDTSNIYQTIDSTIFGIVNLSTKQVVYYKKLLGTVNTAQYMPDGYIGISYTTRANPAAPLTNASLPADFFGFRRIDNRTYNYNGTNKYYVIGSLNVLQYTGITTAPINVNTYFGKCCLLQNLFH